MEKQLQNPQQRSQQPARRHQPYNTPDRKMAEKSAVQPNPLLRLQGLIGNAATQRMLLSPNVAQRQGETNAEGAEAAETDERVAQRQEKDVAVASQLDSGPKGQGIRIPVSDGLLNLLDPSRQDEVEEIAQTVTGSEVVSAAAPSDPNDAGDSTGLPAVQRQATTAPAEPALADRHKQAGVSYKPISKPQLFNKKTGQPQIGDITQGGAKDCYLAAALSALAKTNPGYLKKLIKDNGDGTYDVTLFTDKKTGLLGLFGSERQSQVVKVTSSFPTNPDGTPAFIQKGEDDAIWAMIIEKAFAQQQGGYDKISEEYKDHILGFQALTGGTVERKDVSSLSSKEIHTQLGQWLKDGYAVTALAKNALPERQLNENEANITDPSILRTNHEYAVLRVGGNDESNYAIYLHNPHGSNHIQLFMSVFRQSFTQMVATKVK
jgi:hypothetical protein